jgi:hypothetical protein
MAAVAGTVVGLGLWEAFAVGWVRNCGQGLTAFPYYLTCVGLAAVFLGPYGGIVVAAVAVGPQEQRRWARLGALAGFAAGAVILLVSLLTVEAGPCLASMGLPTPLFTGAVGALLGRELAGASLEFRALCFAGVVALVAAPALRLTGYYPYERASSVLADIAAACALPLVAIYCVRQRPSGPFCAAALGGFALGLLSCLAAPVSWVVTHTWPVPFDIACVLLHWGLVGAFVGAYVGLAVAALRSGSPVEQASAWRGAITGLAAGTVLVLLLAALPHTPPRSLWASDPLIPIVVGAAGTLLGRALMAPTSSSTYPSAEVTDSPASPAAGG